MQPVFPSASCAAQINLLIHLNDDDDDDDDDDERMNFNVA